MNNYALSEALRGRLGRAESLLRKAAGQSDADTQVRQNLGLIVGLQGKFSEAERIAMGDLPHLTGLDLYHEKMAEVAV